MPYRPKVQQGGPLENCGRKKDSTERRINESLSTSQPGCPVAAHRVRVDRYRQHVARSDSTDAIRSMAARRCWCGRSFLRSVRWRYFVGSALSGLLIKRFGFLPLLVAGFGLMAASTACLGFEPWVVGVLSISGTGMSLGLTIPTINLLVSELNIGRRAAALNLLNLAWGVGAVSGPVLVPTLARAVGLAVALLCVAAPFVVIAILVGRRPVILPVAVEAAEGTSSGTMRLWMTPYALLTAALVFVNIGTESATGGWIASYARRLGPSSQLSWTVAPSLFWAGLLAGRAAAPFLLRRVREVRLVLVGMFVAVSGLVVILLGTTIAPVLIGVGLTGLGLAPVFPTTIALFTGRFGRDASRLTGSLDWHRLTTMRYVLD